MIDSIFKVIDLSLSTNNPKLLKTLPYMTKYKTTQMLASVNKNNTTLQQLIVDADLTEAFFAECEKKIINFCLTKK